MGELFASDVKGVASAIAVMFNWTLVFIITKTFGMMKESWGTGEFELEISRKNFLLTQIFLATGPTFYFFASFMVVGTIFVFIKVPETKGKSNAQIQAILAGKN